MPCIFCIAALGVAATVVVPVLMDSLEEALRTAALDLVRVRESGSSVVWAGTFEFRATDGSLVRAGARVTVYKEALRARIQVTTHGLAHDDVHLLQDRVAGLLGSTVVSRWDEQDQASASAPNREAPAEPVQVLRSDAASETAPDLSG